MTDFLPGIELCRAFYTEAVAPILRTASPGLVHSAALLGPGSDVLGYDSPRSTDHDWGPRVLLFVSARDAATRADELDGLLGRELPSRFRGRSTGYGPPGPDGSRLPDRAGHRPVAHRVEVHDLGRWLQKALGFDPRGGIRTADWLLTPSQTLLEVTAGAVFHDGLGELDPVRKALGWYPRDVWLYLLASQWRRIEQEEPFAARCAEAGDDLGARLVAARLVRDLMRLAFLVERRYAPYTKWLGSAFARLEIGPALGPILQAALDASDDGDRQAALTKASELVATRFNALGVTEWVDPSVRTFHRRPYLVLGADRFADASRAAISDDRVRALPLGLGSIDQWVDSTDVQSQVRRARRTALVYGLDG